MSIMVSRDEILSALEVVIDPELRKSIVELDMVRAIDVRDDGIVDVTVSLTTPGCPIRGHFQSAVRDAVMGLEGVRSVSVDFDVLDDTQKAALRAKLGVSELPAGGRPVRLSTGISGASTKMPSDSGTASSPRIGDRKMIFPSRRATKVPVIWSPLRR